jgi:hypothetical protein
MTSSVIVKINSAAREDFLRPPVSAVLRIVNPKTTLVVARGVLR